MLIAEFTSPTLSPASPSLAADPMVRRWTRDEYYRLGDEGFFQGERVQLIYGEIVKMSPMLTPHAASLQLSYKALLRAYGEGFSIRDQLPLFISEHSEPQPDLAVVTGGPRDYLKEHPRTALLVVEVSDSTLRFDRTIKRKLYAQANVVEYWIVNLVDRCLEIFRNPSDGDYTHTETLSAVDQALPPGAQQSILVADLLP